MGGDGKVGAGDATGANVGGKGAVLRPTSTGCPVLTQPLEPHRAQLPCPRHAHQECSSSPAFPGAKPLTLENQK